MPPGVSRRELIIVDVLRATDVRDRLRRARALVNRFVPRGAILLSALTFAAYAMGLLRDRVFAQTFGAGPELDAYNAAFALPEVALDVLIAGGLAAPFVPIFTTLRRDSEDDAIAFGQTILTGAVGVLAVVSAALFVVADATATVVAPGFGPAERARYVALFRIMCATPVIFAASITAGEVLVAHRRFLAYGLAPVLYNGGIVAGTIVLSGRFGIFGSAAGAVFGALLHLAIRLWELRRTPFRVRPRLMLRMPAVAEFVRLMAPKMASQPIDPVTFVVFTSLASTLGAGSVAALSFARNFQGAAVSIIGAAFSIAAFPSLSSAYAAGDRAAFRTTIRENLAVVGILAALAAVALVVFGRLIIERFLGGGAFGPADIARTAGMLGVFAVSVPLESLTNPLARALYATRNTLLAVGAGLVGFGVTVAVAASLVGPLGLLAIPSAYVVGMAIRLVLLAIALVVRLGTLPNAAELPKAGTGD